MKNYLWSLVFVLFPSALFGQVMLAEGFGGEDTFPLVTSAAKGSGLYYSERDFEVVKKDFAVAGGGYKTCDWLYTRCLVGKGKD